MGGWLAQQSYSYDKLNRLSTATEAGANGWRQTFGYDRWGNRWGNRWVDTSSATYGVPTTGVANNAAWFTAKNRLNLTGGFDAAGNQTQVNPYTLNYDGENRVVEGTSTNNGSQSYRYDGEGRRVKKVVGGLTTTQELSS